MSPRPETPELTGNTVWRVARLTSLALLLVLGGQASEAQESNPQRAIERLEGCSKKERQQRCINILARRPAANGKQAIKAQVRGGRIIWYEYDPKTGNVRRTN